MRKIKKAISAIIIGTSLCVCSVKVKAEEISNHPLQVEVGDYSDDLLKYIQDNWMNMFGDDELQSFSGDQIVVGEPYGIYSTDEEKMVATKFPFYVNDKCVQIVDVFPVSDNEYTWSAIISEEHLKEIDDLRKKEGSYRFEVSNTSGETAPIVEIVRTDEKNSMMSRSDSHSENYDSSYSDISKPILVFDVDDYPAVSQVNATSYPDKKILPMEPKETQGSLPWGAAYAGARILSYEFTKDIRAKTIMEWVYWTPSSHPNLDNKTLSRSDLIRYAKSLGSSPYEVSRSLYRNEIMEEISNYRMIYAGTENVSNRSSRHAFVVYGYEKDKFYYYWNPWGETYRSEMSDNLIYTTKDYGGLRFDWVTSIRNFTW